MPDDKAKGGDYASYVAEIELYEREFGPWVTRAKKIVRLYKDADNARGGKKRFNILWSNVQTLKPALYARDPQPVAERRFKDADPLGRVASEVIERCAAYTIDCQNTGQVIRQVVDDRLLCGRGVTWIRYCPTVDKVQISAESEEYDEELAYEEVIPDYVYWEDFGHNLARTWAEVSMVWRKVYLSRKRLVDRFGKIGSEIPLDHSPKGLKDEKVSDKVSKACVYELWDKDTGKVVFLSRSHPKIIEAVDKPLTLTGCFPCPRPLFATLTNDSLVPVPDYALYQTQAQEIEDLTNRIGHLQKALKVAGVYDSSAPELSRLLNEGYENKLIPVDTYAAFAERGGLKGAIDFLPVTDIATVLISLYEARGKAKEDLYEITGIADIIRGNSNPKETATAQQIKGRFAVLRISDSQSEVQRYVRDVIRLISEVIAENFSLDTIKAISGVKLLTREEKAQAQAAIQQQQAMQQMQAQQGQQGQQPPQAPPIPPEVQKLMKEPAWEDVHELLSHQVLREFRIDIETDSTIRTDEEMERKSRTEFLQAAGQYVRSAMEAPPEMAPLLSELLMFGIRSFRTSRSLEPAFEDMIEKMKQPKQPAPDPEMAKLQQQAQLDQQKLAAEVQAEQAKQQAQQQQAIAEQQVSNQRAQLEFERTMELERYKAEMEIRVQIEKAKIEAQTKLQIAQITAAHQPESAEAA